MTGAITIVYLNLQLQDPGELIVIPFTNLVVTLSGPASSLVPGIPFFINITISHNSTDSRDARNFVVTLAEYVEEYVLPPTSITSIIANQAEMTHSKTILTLGEQPTRAGFSSSMVCLVMQTLFRGWGSGWG